MVQLSEYFGSEMQGRHTEWVRQQRWFIKSRHDQVKRKEASEKLDDEVLSAATDLVLATKTEIANFESKLDNYDEATVAALMKNQEMLESVNARIFDMLGRAYVMEDGRRIFKTEDGGRNSSL